LLGAGGSGFLLFYVKQDKQEAVKKALVHLVHTPFRFDATGTSIIF